MWWYDYEYKWRDSTTGEVRGIYLKDCDYFLVIAKTNLVV